MTDYLMQLLASDFVRYLAAGQMLFVLGVSIFVDLTHAPQAPLPLRFMWRAVLWVVAAATVGLVINAMTPIPPTPGAYLVAAGALPSLATGAYVLYWMINQLREHPMKFTSRPVLVTFSVLAALQVLSGAAALGDVIGVTAFALFNIVVAAVQVGMTFYVQNEVTPNASVAAYLSSDGRTKAGQASDIPTGMPVDIDVKS